ncbi:unnamed protein product [Pleuronectes platessa]|uniref:Uncharacterized protein n=1 Tax=Pleuronectes platessa TaxID=8262 RepID=A0A9N7VJQ8_PLEPL|nr:unnamed protein product [Pleuronectes platessa]
MSLGQSEAEWLNCSGQQADGFLIHCPHLPESAKRRLQPSSLSGKPKEGVVRPQGGHHPQEDKKLWETWKNWVK